jgi:hypothetical protein
MIPKDCENVICLFKTDPIGKKYIEDNPEVCTNCKCKHMYITKPDYTNIPFKKGSGRHFGKEYDGFCLEL